jgi:hypothetical protein
MSGPHQSRAMLSAIAFAAVFVLIAATYALFHGYFDNGRFETEHVEWSSSKQVAMIAKRSDDEALGGYQIFLLVGDHLYSPKELRHAYYYDKVIFRADVDCLAAEWTDPGHLVIKCDRASIDPDSIAVEKRNQDGLTISYLNIPPKTH